MLDPRAVLEVALDVFLAICMFAGGVALAIWLTGAQI